MLKKDSKEVSCALKSDTKGREYMLGTQSKNKKRKNKPKQKAQQEKREKIYSQKSTHTHTTSSTLHSWSETENVCVHGVFLLFVEERHIVLFI